MLAIQCQCTFITPLYKIYETIITQIKFTVNCEDTRMFIEGLLLGFSWFDEFNG